MNILKRNNPNGGLNNALQIPESVGFPDGEAKVVELCNYAATVDTGTIATVDTVSIGGVEYKFDPVTTTADKADELLTTALRSAVYQAGGTDQGVQVRKDGANLVVETAPSELVFDYIDTNATTFAKSGCFNYGPFGE